MLADDQLQHRLVAQSALSGFLAQLVDQVLLEDDRGGQGFADRSQATGCPDVLSKIPPLEALDLEVAVPAFFSAAFELRLRFGIEPLSVARMGRADRPELVAAASADERQPATSASPSISPARLVVRGLDDATREEDGGGEK